ncbi:MAG: ribonuclease E inhibitor RraB [Armatimonadetes bacterium]|nr:ribonuclease E inhibitor RraB [Armatimonadota bacterium]
MKPIGLFGRRPKRFWAQEEYHRTLAEQLKLGSVSLERLAELSVGTEDQFKLEFFFHTDVRRKALKLAGDLEELGCQVEQQQSAADKALTVITGRTPPLTMTAAALQAWTQRMCRLGFERDCRFDGWEIT